MEILQFLLSFILKDFGGEKLEPVFKLLQENNFDIKNVLKNLKPEVIMPLITQFMSMGAQRKNSPTENVGEYVGLDPLSHIADTQIVSCLNQYFST